MLSFTTTTTYDTPDNTANDNTCTMAALLAEFQVPGLTESALVKIDQAINDVEDRMSWDRISWQYDRDVKATS